MRFLAPLLVCLCTLPLTSADSLPLSTTPPARFHFDLDDTTLTVGAGFACAIAAPAEGEVSTSAAGGRIACWGGPAAAAVGALTPPSGFFAQISASDSHACAVRAGDGAILCWGGGARRGKRTPLHGSGYMQVSVGGSVLCALSPLGSVICAGGSNLGQMHPPLSLASGVVQVSCGKSTCCGLREGGVGQQGRIACWGGNFAGVAEPPAGDSWVQVSLASEASACAVNASGSITCWGAIAGPAGGQVLMYANSSGGGGGGGGGFVQVATMHGGGACGLRAVGSIECWGEARRMWGGGRAGGPRAAAVYVEIAAFDLALCAISVSSAAPAVACWGQHAALLQPPEGLVPLWGGGAGASEGGGAAPTEAGAAGASEGEEGGEGAASGAAST